MINKLLSEQYQSDVEFYEYLQEKMEIEADFMMACMENNVLMEAENQNKESWLDKAKAVIDKVINMFLTKLNDIVKGDKIRWFNDNKDKFTNLDYSGLSTSLVPRWNFSTQDIIDTVNNVMKMGLDQYWPNPNEYERLSSREEVEKYKEFGKITINGMTFAESIKIKFSGGTNKIPNPIVVDEKSNPTLQSICINQAIPYISSYSTKWTRFARDVANEYGRIIRRMDSELKKRDKKNLKESYLYLEECMMDESSLAYLCEAEGVVNDTKTDKTSSEPPKVGQVIDKKEVNEQIKNVSTAELRYRKNIMSLCQITITSALTEIETRFNVYMNLLENIYKARKEEINKSSKQTDVKTDNKPVPTKKNA